MFEVVVALAMSCFVIVLRFASSAEMYALAVKSAMKTGSALSSAQKI